MKTKTTPPAASFALIIKGSRKIVDYRDEFHEYGKGYYSKLETAVLTRQARDAIANFGLAFANPYYVDSVVRAIQQATTVTGSINPPFWLAGNGGAHIVVANGLVNLEAALAGNFANCRQPHTPDYFSLTHQDFDYDETSTCPEWDNFLDRFTCGDVAIIEMLAEFCGSCFMPDMRHERFLWLDGMPSSGKSTFLDVIIQVLGVANCSGCPLADYGSRFGMTPSLHKLANFDFDADVLKPFNETALQRYVSQDPHNFDRKGLEGVEARPTARSFFAGNGLPRVRGRSGAIFKRALIVPCRQVIAKPLLGRADEYVRREASGILNWMLRGAARLKQRGDFAVPQACRVAVQREQRDANPARRFLESNVTAVDGEPIVKNWLYGKYKQWCKDRGHESLHELNFGKEFWRVFPNATDGKTKGLNRKNCYYGVKFNLEEYDDFDTRLDDSPLPIETKDRIKILTYELQCSGLSFEEAKKKAHDQYGEPEELVDFGKLAKCNAPATTKASTVKAKVDPGLAGVLDGLGGNTVTITADDPEMTDLLNKLGANDG